MQSNEQQRYNRKADPVPSEVPSSAGVQQISDTAIGIVTGITRHFLSFRLSVPVV